jgi:hypothetical protein
MQLPIIGEEVSHDVLPDSTRQARPRTSQTLQTPSCSRRRTQPADLVSAGRLRPSIGVRRSRANADDRLPLASLGRVQGGDRIVKG